jgi:peptide chain release factor 3
LIFHIRETLLDLHDTGNFKIGDSLNRGRNNTITKEFRVSRQSISGILIMPIHLKSKQLEKGVDQLMDEGVAQLFTLEMNGRKVIGTVGALQYEVIQYRLEHEYGAKCTYENFPAYKACWVIPTDPKNEEFKEFLRIKQKFMARDKPGRLVFLADSEFSIQMTQQKYPSVKLYFTSEIIE